MRSVIQYIAVLLSLAAPYRSYGEVPSWAKKNTIKLAGYLLTAVCEGIGPSVTLARKEAIITCQISARQFLKTDIKVKTLSVETEHSIGFHQEIESSDSIRGLSCLPKRDEVIEKEGQYQVWIECQFDLSKSKIEAVPEKRLSVSSGANQSGLLPVSALKVKETDSDHKTVFLASVPKCDSVIIRGTKSRTVPCSSNPLKLILELGDTEIIIRAKDFVPKTIPINKEGTIEEVQIFLERN